MLPNDYYLANFNFLVEFVESTYRGLLNKAERDWLQCLRKLSKPAQQLYVRLLGRKAIQFRLSRLSYPEIESLAAAADELVIAGLASDDIGQDLSVILPSFTKPELIKLLDLKHLSGMPRVALSENLLSRQVNEQQRYIYLLTECDSWLKINGHHHFTLFRLCFFGNLYQDGSEFVRRDLGTLTYESYVIDEKSKPFSSRQQLEAHLQYFECDALCELVDFNDPSSLITLSKKLPGRWPNDHHLDRRIDRLRNRLARQLERLGRANDALTLYEQSINPPGRERRVRLLHKLEKQEQASDLLSSILSGPCGEAELHFAEQFSNKIGNSKGAQEKPFKPFTTKLALHESEERVEIAAKTFFSQFGACYFVENSLIDGVLGLFIWDIIFANVSGAFFNPFQSAPSDFYHQEFIRMRQNLIDDRMLELDESIKFSARVRDTFHARQGIVNPLVRWHKLSDELLSKALLRIPAEHWRSLFTRLLKDLRENSSGLPDLILFPEQGGYELIEIKGPGDALQKNQRRWMRYFAERDIPCRVVNVRWTQTTFSSSDDKASDSNTVTTGQGLAGRSTRESDA